MTVVDLELVNKQLDKEIGEAWKSISRAMAESDLEFVAQLEKYKDGLVRAHSAINSITPDPSLSTVKEELSGQNWPLQQIAISITNIKKYNELANEYEVGSIRRHLDTIVQRGYRAEQICRGLKVHKAN